jgi:hypothetical protein
MDPRACDEDGEVLSPRQLAVNENLLAWPERFPAERVKEFEFELGQYAFAGQYQQSPVPRKGGIFRREYWPPHVPTKDNKWPDFDFILVSVDSAFTEKEENDPTGCTTWGLVELAISGCVSPTQTFHFDIKLRILGRGNGRS